MTLMKHELKLLLDDYDKCDNLSIKEQILIDIYLLNEALTILQQDEQNHLFNGK
ncbi:hypothetical protein [Psychrobacillus glaciei]|uniref:hypothetical protein n=1 Tax=Psychrobacillus glaciei TaxID=2283160 RepID=UPI001CEF784D|nr:hypothetical protein [Psychrobacillus glaciei]